MNYEIVRSETIPRFDTSASGNWNLFIPKAAREVVIKEAEMNYDVEDSK